MGKAISSDLRLRIVRGIAAGMSRRAGAWFLFLPKYSPDLNPIEHFFAKLKTLLRKAKARTYDALWRAVGDICALFDPQECWNYLIDAGYVADKTPDALGAAPSIYAEDRSGALGP